MSGFLKTVSNLGQNFFACLLAIAGREVIEKPGGLSSKRRVRAESPGAWLPAGTKREPRLYPLRGGEGYREKVFAQSKYLFS